MPLGEWLRAQRAAREDARKIRSAVDEALATNKANIAAARERGLSMQDMFALRGTSAVADIDFAPDALIAQRVKTSMRGNPTGRRV